MATTVVRVGATSTISSGGGFLPAQAGHADEVLTTDGTTVSWQPTANPSGSLLYLAENYV